jgi:hypothetical protein
MTAWPAALLHFSSTRRKADAPSSWPDEGNVTPRVAMSGGVRRALLILGIYCYRPFQRANYTVIIGARSGCVRGIVDTKTYPLRF